MSELEALEAVKAAYDVNATNRFHWQSLHDLNKLPDAAPLVDGVLFEEIVTVAYGAPEAGKTFVAVDLACCVATGRPWHGRIVKEGPVCYVSAEGGRWIKNRFAAWQREHDTVIPHDRLKLLTEPVRFMEQEERDDFVASVKNLHPSPRLVVIDTFHKCLVGGNENSSSDVGFFFDAVDRVKQATGASMLALHHVNAASAMRGSTSILGDADATFKITRKQEVVTVTAEKCKDWAPASPIKLDLVPFAGSCVLRHRAQLTDTDLKVLGFVVCDCPEDGWTAKDLVSHTAVPKTSLYRSRESLTGLGYIRPVGERIFPTDSGIAFWESHQSQCSPNPIPNNGPTNTGGAYEAPRWDSGIGMTFTQLFADLRQIAARNESARRPRVHSQAGGGRCDDGGGHRRCGG